MTRAARVCVQVVYVSDDVGADSASVPPSVPFLSAPKPPGAPTLTTPQALPLVLTSSQCAHLVSVCMCACVCGSGGGGGQVVSYGMVHAAGPRHVALPTVGGASQ